MNTANSLLAYHAETACSGPITCCYLFRQNKPSTQAKAELNSQLFIYMIFKKVLEMLEPAEEKRKARKNQTCLESSTQDKHS